MFSSFLAVLQFLPARVPKPQSAGSFHVFSKHCQLCDLGIFRCFISHFPMLPSFNHFLAHSPDIFCVFWRNCLTFFEANSISDELQKSACSLALTYWGAGKLSWGSFQVTCPCKNLVAARMTSSFLISVSTHGTFLCSLSRQSPALWQEIFINGFQMSKQREVSYTST